MVYAELICFVAGKNGITEGVNLVRCISACIIPGDLAVEALLYVHIAAVNCVAENVTVFFFNGVGPGGA